MDWTKMIALTGMIACSAACSSKVETNGGGGSTSSSSTMTTTDSVPETTVTGSGPGCPDEAPRAYAECPTVGLTCTYTTGSCALAFTCQTFTFDPTTNPWACGASQSWMGPGAGSCDGCAGGDGCVPCSGASQGDPCDVVGVTCPAGGDGNCNDDARCTGDHTWSIETEAGCCI